MKKSKILMPLTGIAAVGAFAPVIAMSACHKNEFNFIESYELGNDGLMGKDELTAAKTSGITFSIKAKLGIKPVQGHTFYHSWKAQTGSVMYAAEQPEAPITAEIVSEEERIYQGSFVIPVHADATGAEDQVFNFVVTYTEKDADGKVVNTCDKTYTFKYFHDKDQVPAVSGTAIAGTSAAATGKVELAGLTLADDALANISVALPQTLTLTNADQDKLVIDATGVEIVATKDTVNFNAVVTPKTKTTGGTCAFTLTDDLVINFTENTGKYVKKEWSKTVSKTGLTITVTLG